MTDAALAAELAGEAGRILLALRAEGRLEGKALGAEADRQANAFLCEALRRERPLDALLSEEEKDSAARLSAGRCWIVDPLDGTREFLADIDEFTVNIAIVEKETPVAGVVAAPARGLIWRGYVGHGAERLALAPGSAPNAARARMAIRTRARPASGARVLISRSHLDPATDAYVDRLPEARRVPCGSALKFCLVAEGSADLYPRLAPTSEWDVAAGHAVLVAAGGELCKPDGGALRYGRGNFLIPSFIATGDPTHVV